MQTASRRNLPQLTRIRTHERRGALASTWRDVAGGDPSRLRPATHKSVSTSRSADLQYENRSIIGDFSADHIFVDAGPYCRQDVSRRSAGSLENRVTNPVRSE